jgi:hypothetical protein
MSHRVRIAAIAGATTAALLVLYRKIVRPWALRWGATDEEVGRTLPGDAVVPKADFVATRAITIAAAPRHVWPWLVQIGSDRAGWYSYDRIDNGGVPSATSIVPELQHLKPDDLIPMIAGKEIGVWVKEIEPEHRMLWWDRKGEYSWEWVLEEADHGTRLITRLRATTHPWTGRMLYELVATNGDIVMIRKLLLGIRARAEAHATHRAAGLHEVAP